jgi:tetratricopeptide (TPR) repeat protein
MVRVEQGMLDAGIRLMRESVASFIGSGGYLILSEIQGYFARAYMKLEANDEALSALNEGLAIAERTGVLFRNAELLRLKGEIFLNDGSDEKAEALFRMALETARRQEAKSLVMRAAIRLAQLHQRKGNVEEARCLLCDVYGAFTEGFDTRELRMTRRMLAGRWDV